MKITKFEFGDEMGEVIGAYEGMPEKSYRDAKGISRSDFAKFVEELSGSPATYIAPNRLKQYDTKKEDALVIGTAVHALSMGFEFDFKAYPDVFKATTETGRKNQMIAEGCAESLKSCQMFHDITASAYKEVSVFVKDPLSGLTLKARFDLLIADEATNSHKVYDIKTCQSVSDKDLSESAWDFGYWLQQAWYLYVLELAAGKPLSFQGELGQQDYYNHFEFIAVEKSHPFPVVFYKLSDEAMDMGCKVIARDLPKLRDCINSGVYHPAKKIISMPAWAKIKEEK